MVLWRRVNEEPVDSSAQGQLWQTIEIFLKPWIDAKVNPRNPSTCWDLAQECGLAEPETRCCPQFKAEGCYFLAAWTSLTIQSPLSRHPKPYSIYLRATITNRPGLMPNFPHPAHWLGRELSLPLNLQERHVF